MEVLNLFDPGVKQNIISRVNQLTAASQKKWGKMDVAQMLAHCQLPIAMTLGTHQVKGSFLLKLIGPLFKSVLYDNKPYKQGLPTDSTYVIADTREFEIEKEGLKDKIEKFTENNVTDKRHPVFGHLTKEQWSKATWKHLDHHLRQFGV